ncbi:MAG: hypothetical protein V8Q84_12510 [Bilophila sp.]
MQRRARAGNRRHPPQARPQSTARETILSLRESVRVSLMELTNWHRDMQKKGTEHSVSRLCELLGPLPLEGALYLMARAPHEEISSSVSQYIYKWKQIGSRISATICTIWALSPGRASGGQAPSARRQA